MTNMIFSSANGMEVLVIAMTALVIQSTSGQSCTATVGSLSCTGLNSSSTTTLVEGLSEAAALQTNFQLSIYNSDVMAYQADLLTGYDITYVSITESPAVTHVPYPFLSGITSQVTKLYLANDYLHDIAAAQMDLPFKGSVTTLSFSYSYVTYIEPNAFLGYDQVTEIDLDRNDLLHLAADTFTGMTSLTSLQLWKSHLTTVDVGGFGTLPALKNLDIQYSDLTFLQEGVFNGLPDKFEFNVGGINFNCTCELQWLKDWLNETDQLGQAFCRWPRSGYFADINFCGPPTLKLA